MEIVNFKNKTWQEIPEQDNPTMQRNQEPDEGSRPCECILIFKGKHDRITDGGIIVAHVPIRGDITKKGVFWNIENAEIFANALAL